MLHTTISEQINQQIGKELFSAYLYLDIANYYSEQGLDGFENWFYIQTQEEQDHAMLFRRYLLDNEASMTLLPIQSPGGHYQDFGSPLSLALKHEQSVTASISAIYTAARETNDYRTQEFLNWFIREQAEEEKNTADLIKKYALYGHEARGLYQLNQELLARAYTPPDLTIA